MLRACLANPGVCTSFESWGFTDAVTWLTGVRCIRPTGKTKCHRERLPSRPVRLLCLTACRLAALPFDEQYRPKPAAAAMLRVLQQHAERMAAR